jgi:hypothetical protein
MNNIKKTFCLSLIIALVCASPLCHGKKSVVAKINFKTLVSDFQRKTLPKSATSQFILRLKVFLDMNDSQIDKIIKKNYPNAEFSGNETIFDPKDQLHSYVPGRCRFISRIFIEDNPAVGFRSIHFSLVKDLINVLKKEKFQPYGVGQVPKGTYIFRKNGYHIMFKCNDVHNMWEFMLSRI